MDAKWERAKISHYRRNHSRRRVIALFLAVCFVFWMTFICSPGDDGLEGFNEDSSAQDLQAKTEDPSVEPADPFSSRKLGKRNVRDILRSLQLRDQSIASDTSFLEKRTEELHQTETTPFSTPDSKSQLRKLPEAGALMDDKNQTHDRSGGDSLNAEPNELAEGKPELKGTRTNRIPEEDDDIEEVNLKRIAVTPKDKKQSSTDASLENGQQKPLGTIRTIGAKARPDTHQETKDGFNSPKMFPTYQEYLAQEELADSLPDVIHIPFEDATEEMTLEGWEDEWISNAKFDASRWGKLKEPKIDFIYTWVNGSDSAFLDTILPYELNSTLNDPEGKWVASHRVNRYRDWDELRYSIRTVEKYARSFRNQIQILVNAIGQKAVPEDTSLETPQLIVGLQVPLWLSEDDHTKDIVRVVSQEDFFDESEHNCLPTFNSLTIENQIQNTKSNTDRFFALSDDMLLGRPHAASDLYSPLFGPTMAFKTNGYNTRSPPTDVDAHRFGEKPFLIYTSWMLNRRFGERKRKGQVHFGHSMSRTLTREAIESFPRPALQSTCQRFRGETGFQLYSWYVSFHYLIERHREALLWSYIMQRSDINQDGNIDWEERQAVMSDLEEGILNVGNTTFRSRMFYQVAESLNDAGLEAPKANLDVLWTSLDGPATIQNIDCAEFNVNECMAPGFSTNSSDTHHTNPVFAAASIFDYVARQHPKCGDCLIKLLLSRVEQGLEPMLPYPDTQPEMRSTVVKSLIRYQYTIIQPDNQFVMVTDAQQVKKELHKRLLKDKKLVSQLCLNDDVTTDDKNALTELKKAMITLFEGLVPERSAFEIVP